MTDNTWRTVAQWGLIITICSMTIDGGTVTAEKGKRQVQTVISNMIKTNEATQMAPSDQQSISASHCFDSEPCQFGIYKKSQARAYSIELIPSWCTCRPGQRCVARRYDPKKKADIYTCRDILLS